MDHPLAYARFATLEGMHFEAESEAGKCSLKLHEVMRNDRSPNGYECFTLLFQGPPEPKITQALVRLQHGDDRPFDLFLVPVAGDEEGFDYEAVINRKLDQ